MIPTELELRNFLAYRDPMPLSFEGIHVACLAGPNGAGKSSVLDAMTWALWGKARSNSPDELIHQGESDTRVALTFEQSGARYRVIRQRKAGKQGASLLELQAWDAANGTWHSLSERSMRGTQEKIDHLLRLDHETFINSAFLMQGRADEFTTKTPAQRKQVLANILGLWRWEVFEERAKKRGLETQGEIQRLDGRLVEIERELSQREAYEAELARAEGLAREVSERLAVVEKQWADLEKVRSEMVSLQRIADDLARRAAGRERELEEARRDLEMLEMRADKASLTAALAQAKEEWQRLEALHVRLSEVTNQRSASSELAARLRGVNQALGPQTEPLKTRALTLEAAGEPICPTCGQPLSEDHRRQILEELRREIESRRQQYRDNQAQIKSLEAQVAALDEELGTLGELLAERARHEKRMAEVELALAHADEASRQAQTTRDRMARWSTELEKDRGKLEQLEKDLDASENRLKAAVISQQDVDRQRLEKRLADERVGGARQKLATLVAYSAQREQRLAERQNLAIDLALYEDLRMAFSKRGVPAMIIETVVPELERSANELLGRLTDGQLNLRIETQKETKGGDLREALEILISDTLGTRSYELYSGGEAFRINFAIRIALSRLLAHRAGAQLRSLFIDEGFGTQDERGREYLIAAINSIQDDFDRILVITHIDELKEAFPARIEVFKTPEGSQFRLV